MRDVFDDLCTGAGYACATSVIVYLGVLFGAGYLYRSGPKGHQFAYSGEAYANWDGQWYKEVATNGYSCDPNDFSSVAFFPAYPLASRGLARSTGMRPELALLITSNVCLVALFCLMAAYVRSRYPSASPGLAGYVLLAMGLVPTTFFLRMAYSESTFLTLAILTLLAIARGWPLPVIAAIVGLATATRPVGVALIPPLLLGVWRRSSGPWAFLCRAAYLIPIGCWGLIAYMVYQRLAFGDFLAFMQTQANWRLRDPTAPGRRLQSLLLLEPVWSAYIPSAPAYWARFARGEDPLFSLRAADPIFFAGTVLLIVLGAIRRWLSDYEIATAAGLLLIPYATIGYEQYMQSMGRYSAAVIPVYLVIGRLLCRMPPPAVAALAGISGFFLGLYSALFAAWYVFI